MRHPLSRGLATGAVSPLVQGSPKNLGELLRRAVSPLRQAVPLQSTRDAIEDWRKLWLHCQDFRARPRPLSY